MSQLGRLLQFLDRGDVSEIVLHTDRPVSAKVGDEYRSLSRSPVNAAQIDALIGESPIAEIVPAVNGTTPAQRLEMFSRVYSVRAARRGDILQIRIERAPDAVEERPKSRGGKRPASVRAEPRAAALARPATPRRPRTRLITELPDRGTRERGVPTHVDRGTRERGDPSHAYRAPAQRPVSRGRKPPASDVGRERPPATERSTRHVGDEGYRRTKSGAARLVSEALRSILTEARERGASDVHVIAERPVQVRRVGELDSVGEVLSAAAVAEMLLSLLSPGQRRALETLGYVDLSAEVPGAGRMRVNVSRQRTGFKGSFRLVRSPPPTLEELSLPAELAKVTTYHQGLVVISGPSGHGKTTTLGALVDVVNATRARHIITIEDPVEIIHPRKKAIVSQREVGTHTRSFATALKASLREDPDVIVIGELRDREAMEIAMAAAETGHLVLGTMSTPSGAKTIDRLIDVFPPADQPQVRSTLAEALKFIVSQRLLPAASGDDVVAAVELITGSQALRLLIRENKLFHLPNLQQRGRAFGMIRFDDSLAELVRQGRITEETALRYAENRRELGNVLRAGAPAAPAPAAPAAPAAAPAAPAAPATSVAQTGAQKLSDLAARVGKGLFRKRE